jgi:large subunit ribosomal protein L25
VSYSAVRRWEIDEVTETIKFKAEPREDLGTRAARRLREAGRLPAVIYGHNEPVETVSLEGHEVESALGHGVRTLDVVLGQKTQRCLIKEVQYDHLGISAVHLDLARVDVDERVRVTVGIELRGVAKGVSEGGALDQHLVEVEIECLVSDIPETLHPIVNDLDVGDSLLVKDLPLPDGVVAVTDAEERVATVHALAAAAEEPEVAEEGEEEAAEPERIGRVRKEEEGGTEDQS